MERYLDLALALTANLQHEAAEANAIVRKCLIRDYARLSDSNNECKKLKSEVSVKARAVYEAENINKRLREENRQLKQETLDVRSRFNTAFAQITGLKRKVDELQSKLDNERQGRARNINELSFITDEEEVDDEEAQSDVILMGVDLPPSGRSPIPGPSGRSPVPGPDRQSPVPGPSGQSPVPGPNRRSPVPGPSGQCDQPFPFARAHQHLRNLFSDFNE